MGNTVSFSTKSGKVIQFSKKKHDPTARLKQLAQVATPKQEKKISGGLNPILIPILASLAGTALEKVFSLVKEKISGKGLDVDPSLFKTDAQKRQLIRHVLY